MRNVYDYFYEKLNIKGEGFSSPFNSKLIEKNDTVICSMFRDTDKYFKSKGQFHNDVILKNQTFNWTLNPPYYYKIIKRCIGTIIYTLSSENLHNKKLIILFVIPMTKIIRLEKLLYNKYLLGYISNKHIVVGNDTYDNPYPKQYFICNGYITSNIDDNIYYLYGLTFEGDLKKTLFDIAKLWSTYDNTNIQQSNYTQPKKLK